MKALSLWGPWAQLIADRRKPVETRHWYSLHRGPMAIHAAHKIDKDACLEFGYRWNELPRGAVVCIVNVFACVQFGPGFVAPDLYGDYTPGRFGIYMELLEVLNPPVTCIGRQGVWNWERPSGRNK